MQVNWTYDEFVGARVRDRRRRTTLMKACQQLLERCGLSFSRALGGRRKALSRMLNDGQLTHEDLLEGHIAATSARCQQHELVLVLSDTTFMDFSTHHSVQGLGPTGSSKHARGFLTHSALALTTTGVPLGLLHQHHWVRDPEQAGSAQQRRQRLSHDKESHKWLQARQAVEARLPTWQRALLVQDREADIFAFMAAPRPANIDLLVRATQARTVDVQTDAGLRRCALPQALADAPVVGSKTVHVPAAPGAEPREACLSVRCTSVVLQPPHNGLSEGWGPVRLTAIRALEESPPADVKEPLEWILLTTLEAPWEPPQQADAHWALRLVAYYALRWVVERFHFVLKSGCGCEKLQCETLEALQKGLSLFSVVAWRLLHVMYLSRYQPQVPASEAVGPAEKQLLERATKRPVETVSDALVAVAVLGGFHPLPSAPKPGAKSLWLGFRRLADMLAGFLLSQPAGGT